MWFLVYGKMGKKNKISVGYPDKKSASLCRDGLFDSGYNTVFMFRVAGGIGVTALRSLTAR